MADKDSNKLAYKIVDLATGESVSDKTVTGDPTEEIGPELIS